MKTLWQCWRFSRFAGLVTGWLTEWSASNFGALCGRHQIWGYTISLSSSPLCWEKCFKRLFGWIQIPVRGKMYKCWKTFVFMQCTDKSPTLSLKCLNDNLWRGTSQGSSRNYKWTENWAMYQHPLSHPRSVHQGEKTCERQTSCEKTNSRRQTSIKFWPCTVCTVVRIIWAALWLIRQMQSRRDLKIDLLPPIKVIPVHFRLIVGRWAHFHKEDLNTWEMVITVIRVVITYNWAVPRASESCGQ